jgi:hypothetical protein
MSRRGLGDRLRERFQSQIARPLDREVGGRVRRWRNSGRGYRPIFVAGAMGSGTSLLALALGQRFDFAGVVYESAHEVSHRSILNNAPPDHFASIQAYEDAILPRASWSVEEGRAALLDLYRSVARGASDLVVDKGPNTNLVRAEFLARCFPEGRFLLVFRDPLVNVEGFRRKWTTFGRDSLAENLRFYREIHQRFLDASSRFADRLLTVEYETLVEHHDTLLDAVGRAWDLPSASRRRRLASRANVPGMGARNVRGGRIEVVRDANAGSYQRVEPGLADEVRAALAPLHERLRKSALQP